ncbi:MAG: sulfite exporter TauE/SafE family protein [Chloroflexi bacterium]|nr:sulfite exporter TauE/SafE family protein [Chloroflexota bacterium]
MVPYLIICGVALLVAALTLFSGFGLGTLLMPAFALFFPLPVAVAATAVVHLANNLFKVGLLGKNADWRVVLRFAFPGALAAIVGAALLNLFADVPPLLSYALGGQEHSVTLVKLVISLVIIAFAVLELSPAGDKLAFDRKYLAAGGALSGFFGGLSGHQGALRSAFLIKLGLSKEAFVGTGVVSAVIVDVARLLVYGLAFYGVRFAQASGEMAGLVIAATVAAFIGSFIGARLLKKVTLRGVQVIVGVLLIAIGLGMGSGLI